MLAIQADGAEIRTVQSLADGEALHPMQEAFWDNHGLQCGFCTPGMLLRACELVEENPDPTDDEIREGIAGNVCRCTGYQFIVDSIRMVNSGMLPAFQMSPSSPVMQSMTEFMTAGQRKGFTDFRGLIESHIDFEEIASWGPHAGRPVLILGAANVNSGALAKFVSRNETIRVEHILASCAVPTIFPAVQIGKDAYWDGLFSDNPPIEELIRPRSVGGAGRYPRSPGPARTRS